MYIHRYAYTNIHDYTQIYIHKYIYIYIYTCISIYLHAYTHIGIDIDIDNAHTCIWICVRCLCA